MTIRIRTTVAAASLGLIAMASGPAFSENATTAYANKLAADHAAAIADIEATLAMTPAFFSLFPEGKFAGVWADFKTVELSPDTALDGKTKQLIALAVAANAECAACIYFHTSAALANGATAKEIQETVAVAVIGGKWSEVLTAEHEHTVRADADALFDLGSLRVKPAVPMN